LELEHFGSWLKQRREARGMTLAEVSRATKIKETALELLEQAKLDLLPAQVFVRGWVSAYARLIGLDEADALRRYRAHAHVADKTPDVPPSAIELVPNDEPPPIIDRRRVGVVMVVLLILVVATLTLSLLLRHGPGPGAGLS
jgi:cytoskeletal protein RodZ